MAASQRGEASGWELCDVYIADQLLQFWIGDQLIKAIGRTGTGEVRKKHAAGSRPQR